MSHAQRAVELVVADALPSRRISIFCWVTAAREVGNFLTDAGAGIHALRTVETCGFADFPLTSVRRYSHSPGWKRGNSTALVSESAAGAGVSGGSAARKAHARATAQGGIHGHDGTEVVGADDAAVERCGGGIRT